MFNKSAIIEAKADEFMAECKKAIDSVPFVPSSLKNKAVGPLRETFIKYCQKAVDECQVGPCTAS